MGQPNIDSHDASVVHHAAEGNMGQSAAFFKQLTGDPAATFIRMIVLDVVSDPSTVGPALLSYWGDVLKVTNIQYAKLLPRNAVIAQRLNSNATSAFFPLFLFPFFPSHLSLPCKPGEMIWAMFENPNARVKNLGFWFCRISEPHIFDDVNHTHPSSKMNYDLENPETLVGNDSEVKYQMHNGAYSSFKDGTARVIEGTEMITPVGNYGNRLNVFEKLVSSPNAARLMQYEAVPRFKKRPGDVVLEGSNNSLIVLGTDRSGSIGNIDSYGLAHGLLDVVSTSKISGSNGSIDMVVGRGYSPITGGSSVDTTSIDSVSGKDIKIKEEIAKIPSTLVTKNEGDPDFANDRSRILLSQRTQVDSNFGLSSYSSKYGISDSIEGDAAITIKTDKVRIIARSDVSLIVTNFESNAASINNTEPGYKIDSADQQQWASITIKTNGDIVFTPSAKGYIKLGDDTADRALLCTDSPATLNDGRVDPKTQSIGNTMGGVFGGTQIAGQGTWAQKILVTGANAVAVSGSI